MEEEIKAEFERSGFELDGADDILSKCLTYCINFQLSPSDLISNWEIFYLNRQLTSLKIESGQMDAFLTHLQNEAKERIAKEASHLHVYSNNDVDMLLNGDNEGGILETISGQQEKGELYNSIATPRTNEKPSSTKALDISNRITPFGQRVNKFSVHVAFNAKNIDDEIRDEEPRDMEDDIIRRVQPKERCSLQVRVLKPESGCRFMYDTTEYQFNCLENRIIKHANALAASGLYGEPTDATSASQKNIFAVGMISCDGEGHLNEKSILLQGSVEHSGGQRVRLDIQRLDHYSLFPGQVIGIEGHNPSGHCFVASKLVDNLPLSSNMGFPPTKKLALDQEYQSESASNNCRVLSLVVAAGPFTTTDNLLFEPLTELLAYARRKQPQLIILLGPFIDSEHPEIKKGTADQSFDDIFHDEIIRRLQDYAEFMGPSARLILLPSTRDANHDFVFPQPAFDIHLPTNMTDQITSVTNPTLLGANELTIGCCTMDILKQLSGEEISRIPAADGQSGDRMGRLACHLLKQQSYYPLYPPSVGVPLDLSLAPEALQIPSIPDILLLPSDLAPFVKVLSLEGNDGENVRCICVNPGRLAKGIGGGTFAEVNYNKSPDDTCASITRI